MKLAGFFGIAVITSITASAVLVQSPLTHVKPTVKAIVASTLPFAESQLIGKYYQGDGLGANLHLDLNQNHRFSFRWTGCLGEYDKNEGIWRLEGDMVFLQPEKPNKREGFQGTNLRFVPMVWNKRLFLVDEYEAPGFCSTLGQNMPEIRGDDIHGMNYIHLNIDFKPSPIDYPNYVPERFQRFVGVPPLKSKIVELVNDGTVRLDRGSKYGFSVGLMLCSSDWSSANLEIIRVTENSAIAKPVYFANTPNRVKIGDVFSSGGTYHQPNGTGSTRLENPVKPPPE
jgi:hypothetical protein